MEVRWERSIRIRDYTLGKFASAALAMLAHCFDEQLIALTYLAERIDHYSRQFKPLADAAWEEFQLHKTNKCKVAAG